MKRSISSLLVLVMVLTSVLAFPVASTAKTHESPPAENLEINVRYSDSTTYKYKRTLPLTYMSSNSQSASYNFVDRLPALVVDNAKGVKISTILNSLGLKPEEVKSIAFSATDGGKKYFAGSDLLKEGYSYPNFSDRSAWRVTSTGIEILDAAKVSAGKVKVEPMLAYEDQWYRIQNEPTKATAEFRFRLMFGMEDLSKVSNGYVVGFSAENSTAWINKMDIDVTVKDPEGDNPDPNPTTKPSIDPGEVDLIDIKSSWAKEYIEYMYSVGAVTGNQKKEFEPKKNISRAEFATILIKTLIKADIVYLDNTATLNDVKDSHWARRFLSTAVKNGIILPDSKGNVTPERLITREEMATMIARGLEINGTPSKKPSDDSKISSWAKEAVYAVLNNGGMTGLPDGRFDPKGLATKEQTAATIWRTVTNAGYQPKP